MTDVYAYARFSTKQQDKGSSLDRQFEVIDAYCARNGWQIVETLTDKGRSAWKGDHLRVGELGKFKDRIDQGDITPGSILVIENLDRLSRQDVKRARRWIEEVTEAGIKVAVVNLNKVFDEAGLSGENIVDLLQYLLEAQRSTKESERKSTLQKAAIERFMSKARKGIVYSKYGPKWLTGEKDGKFEVIEDRAETVRQMYRWCTDGMGYGAICRKLNESVTPWTTGHDKQAPTKWLPGYVRDILTSPAVEGEYIVKSGPDQTPTGERIQGYYPRIVPAELVARARTAIANRTKTGGPTHNEARNLFAGRVFCGKCGSTMVRTIQRNSQGKGYEYLKCTRFNAAGQIKPGDSPEVRSRKCSNSYLFRYDNFEPVALDEILHLALDHSFFRRTDETAPLAAKVAQLNKDVEILEAQQKRALRFIMSNDEAPEMEAELNELRPRLVSLRVERDTAQQELDKARGQLSPEEHVARVAEVRDAIYSDDDDLRAEARRKVRDALLAIYFRVQCNVGEVPPRRKRPLLSFELYVGDGRYGVQFDNDGNVIGRINLPEQSNFSDLQPGLDTLNTHGAQAQIERRHRASLSASQA